MQIQYEMTLIMSEREEKGSRGGRRDKEREKRKG